MIVAILCSGHKPDADPLAFQSSKHAPSASLFAWLHNYGSCANSRKGCPDLEKKVFIIAETIGHTFDNLDLVVDSLQQAGVQPRAAVGHDTMQVRT